jgi:predicted lipid-binding transport protein (Tim44 family)
VKKMRKTTIATILLVTILLMVCGCAARQQTQTKMTTNPSAKTTTEPTQAEPKADIPPEPEEQEVAEDVTADTEETAAEPATKTTSTAKTDIPVTQEDLNRLKQGINSIQPEDLGGLSQ